ncbi:ABC transporter permease [Nocardiopsis alba]|uniref:ABC transporter permease n=1 Tax=Nocardiopsis alba TaxID=53437 RepID=UPI0035D71E7A
MNAFTGTGTMIRFVLRRDRIRLSIWTLALVGTTAATVPTLDEAFPDEGSRQARAALMETPTGVVFGGPGYGLEDYTIGPMLVNELTASLLIALAVMSVLHVVRHTRAEEESGRAELLRAGSLGSGAHTAAALTTLGLVHLLIGGLVALSMIAFDLPTADSLAYGLGLALAGISFGAITAVCAQVGEHGRTVAGLAFLLIGAFFTARVVGDLAEEGGGLLSWASPFAWVQQTRPFVDLRWEPLALYGAFLAILFTIAHVLAGRRDLGAGLVAARPGPSGAGALLKGVTALHLRQQRGAVIVWTTAVLLFSFAFGTLATEIQGMLDANPDLAVILGGDVDDLVGGFLTAIVGYVVMAGAAFAALSVLRLWNEENTGRAELVLSTAVGRIHWFGGALAVTALATTLIVVAGGLGMGAGASVATEDLDWVPRMVGAALAALPAALVFGALTALVLGAAPRLLPVVWLWLGYGVLVTMLGGLLGFPAWAMNLSAFDLLPKPPMEAFEATPYLLYLGAVLVAGSVSLVAFRRRDLITA